MKGLKLIALVIRGENGFLVGEIRKEIVGFGQVNFDDFSRVTVFGTKKIFVMCKEDDGCFQEIKYGSTGFHVDVGGIHGHDGNVDGFFRFNCLGKKSRGVSGT